MARSDDLSDLLQGVQVEDVPLAGNHSLEIRFPVRRLLPNYTAEPVLHPPANIQTREAPPVDQRRLGIYQSSYVLTVPSYATTRVPYVIAGTEITIEGAFETLTRGPEINLEQDVKSPRVYYFCVNLNRWQCMVNQSGWAWTRTLNELMTRSTDRAYYDVHNRIAFDFGEEFAVTEEARWSAGWGMTSLREQERRETTVEEIGKLLEDASV